MNSLNTTIDISVVVPTYNRGHLVARAIESVLAQEYAPREIVVVDDGSTDDTQARVAPYVKKIRYVRQQNAGSSEARNRGVREASSTWIAFLDSDDVWLPQHLKNIANAINETSGKAGFYFSDMDQAETEGGGSLWEYCGFSIQGPYEFIGDATSIVLLSRQPIMLQTTVLRRSTYLDLGGLGKQYKTRHDTHFFMKLGIGGSACAVAGAGARQTSDDNPDNRLMGASGPGSIGFWRETIPMYRDVLKSFPDLATDNRRLLRSRLADAYWRLSRFAWTDRNIIDWIRQFVKGMIADPSTVALTLVEGSRRKAGLR